MPSETICKIVHQYNREPVPREIMEKLQDVAKDYCAVKNYVYRRYGGVRSLGKLYPGYTVQNEMTRSGLREDLGLPSVYFYLAVFDALGDIKNQWTRTKSQVLRNINQNEGLSAEEKHFLRYLLKVNNALESAVNETPLRLSGTVKRQYELLLAQVDKKKMEHYLSRQVRKHHVRPCTDRADGFSLSERAYRYGDQGIYISIKEKRKRVFIPLTDKNSYTRQLYVKLYPEEDRVELKVPVDVAVREHPDYTETVGISMGMTTMIVTDQGRRYGEELGVFQGRLSEWVREQNRIYSKSRDSNPGRKKYYAKKQRLEEQLHSYINQELNLFLKTERPKILYIPRLPGPGPAGPIKERNHQSSTWQRGYIRSRLAQKCREQSVELAEVFAKGISSECSSCGAEGSRGGETFHCLCCGYEADRKVNAARNARKRGETVGATGQTGKRQSTRRQEASDSAANPRSIRS